MQLKQRKKNHNWGTILSSHFNINYYLFQSSLTVLCFFLCQHRLQQRHAFPFSLPLSPTFLSSSLPFAIMCCVQDCESNDLWECESRLRTGHEFLSSIPPGSRIRKGEERQWRKRERTPMEFKWVCLCCVWTSSVCSLDHSSKRASKSERIRERNRRKDEREEDRKDERREGKRREWKKEKVQTYPQSFLSLLVVVSSLFHPDPLHHDDVGDSGHVSDVSDQKAMFYVGDDDEQVNVCDGSSDDDDDHVFDDAYYDADDEHPTQEEEWRKEEKLEEVNEAVKRKVRSKCWVHLDVE